MLNKYNDSFTDARWEELCELVKHKGMKVSCRDFTNSEMELIINETPLSDNQRMGAKLYYIKKVKINQIALRLGYSESTIKYYKKRVSRAIRTTCVRMFK